MTAGQGRKSLTYRARKRLALVILLIGLPVYVAVAWVVMSALDRPPIWLELLIYVALGFLWALPFRKVFRGVGQPDPDAPAPGQQDGTVQK